MRFEQEVENALYTVEMAGRSGEVPVVLTPVAAQTTDDLKAKTAREDAAAKADVLATYNSLTDPKAKADFFAKNAQAIYASIKV